LVSDEAGIDKDWLEQGDFEIDVAGKRYRARLHLSSPYDPKSERVKMDVII
jgi:4-methylaminobutanoate oxidase (formaldehyde-forming)